MQDCRIHVNIPFSMLHADFLPVFISRRLNPEIGLDAVALDRFSAPDFTAVARRLEESGLEITFHAPFMDLSPGSPDPAIRDLTRRRFEQLLDLIPLFHPKTVVCHAAYDRKRYGMMIDAWLERSLEIWSWFGDNVRNGGGRLVLENVYEHGPREISHLLENLRHADVGFCLDIGHQHAFGRCPMDEWLETLGDYLCQVHLHDNHGRADEHLPAGAGTVDFKKLFGLMAANRYPIQVMTLEPHREEDLKPSLDYLSKIEVIPSPR